MDSISMCWNTLSTSNMDVSDLLENGSDTEESDEELSDD
jgi:hypothetical protein